MDVPMLVKDDDYEGDGRVNRQDDLAHFQSPRLIRNTIEKSIWKEKKTLKRT